MKTSDIWFRLVVEKRRMVSSGELRPLCRKIGKPYDQVVNYLQRRGYVVRVFRGLFYVKSPEEVKLRVLRENTLSLIAEALEKKGVREWYFALESALKLNNMTHEYFALGQVVTDSYKTPRPIWVVDGKYQFFRWNRALHGFGVVKGGGIRYSNLEKTVLDLCYRRYYSKMNPNSVREIFDEYKAKIDLKKAGRYLEHYPKRMSKILEARS